MADKLVYIHNDDTKFTLLYILISLDYQLNKPTIQNSLKVPKVVEPMNKKNLIKLWELV